MSLIKTILISQIVFLLPTIGECAISNQQQDADGSAAAYTDGATGQIYVPSVEIKNGKRYYTWPHWDKSKNRKMQVHRERTAHSGAQWWPHAGLGLFMHWGIVSEFEPSGEAWSGRWHKKRADRFHPQAEIWEAAKTFNPRNYDPDKWMAGARRAGFRYSVLTTKHHDGYALWDSDTALIGVRQSMNGRCLVTPFVEACRKNDVKVGFYYSGMDWYFDRGHMNFALGDEKKMNYKGEIVDALPAPPADRPTAINEFNRRQVEELITRFKPDIWWGDGGHGASIEYIRDLHPPIVINNRDEESGDHASPEGFQMAHPRFIRKPVLENGWWWELCTIIQGGSWHYDKAKGEKINQTDAVLRALAEVRCLGGNLLVNIGPRPDGTFPDEVWRLFDEMAEWMSTNEASVFGINGGGPWPEKCNVPITVKDRTWYFHAKQNHATERDPVVLKDCPVKPLSVTLMRTGDSIDYTYSNATLSFAIPDSLKSVNVTDVVKVEFGEEFDPEPYLFKHW
jgi:alpha-L-fucosidase